ncbi:MAG: hypothetical protein M1840_008861 [Geoglossum simile]|nr:MAG: hypothetical protein M1840_008861 [Geoglossum simile]
MSRAPQSPRPLGQPGAGYTNGKGYSDQERSRYNQYDNPTASAGAGAGGGARGGRIGGYGGFLDGAGNRPTTPSRERSRGQELEPTAGNWRRRPDRGDREWSEQSRSRNRSAGRGPPGGGRRPGDGQGTKQIEG